MAKNILVVTGVVAAVLFLLPIVAHVLRGAEPEPFEQVTVGMSYREVVALMGSEGQLVTRPAASDDAPPVAPSESAEVAAGAGAMAVAGAWAWAEPERVVLERQVYVWPGTEGDYELEVEDGKVVGKRCPGDSATLGGVQRAGQSDNTQAATVEQYQQVKVGMRYDQVKRIFGSAGTMEFDLDTNTGSASSLLGGGDAGDSQIAVGVYSWVAEGGGQFLITFVKGEVGSKAFSREGGGSINSLVGLEDSTRLLGGLLRQ